MTTISDREIADIWFQRLVPLLKNRKLPCERGPARECSPDEFMFMQVSGNCAHFKHYGTRNYIYVRKAGPAGVLDAPSPNGWELFVPVTTSSFHLGFFDA
jgi:hypothetical protein